MFGLQRAHTYYTTSLAAAGTMPTPSDGIVSEYWLDPGPRARTRGGWYRVHCRLICMEIAHLHPIVLQAMLYSMCELSESQTSVSHHVNFRDISYHFPLCSLKRACSAPLHTARERVNNSEIHVMCYTCLACTELKHAIQHRLQQLALHQRRRMA